MTTTQILALARRKILEKTEEIVDTDTLLLYGTLAQNDIVKKGFPNPEIQKATLVVTNGIATLPLLFGTLYNDGFDTDNNQFPELSIADFQKKTLDRSMCIEAGQLNVSPDTTSSITIRYYPIAPAISLVQDPTIDEYFHECIMYGMVYRAHEDLQDEALAAFYQAKYDSMLSEKLKTTSSYEEKNQNGGQLFVYQNFLGGGSSFGNVNKF